MVITKVMADEVAEALMAETEAKNMEQLDKFKEKIKGIILSRIPEPVVKMAEIHEGYFNCRDMVSLGYKFKYMKIKFDKELPIISDVEDWFDVNEMGALVAEYEPIMENINNTEIKKSQIGKLVYGCKTDKQLEVKFPEAFTAFQSIYQKQELKGVITVADL